MEKGADILAQGSVEFQCKVSQVAIVRSKVSQE